jgi:hypothetical protein
VERLPEISYLTAGLGQAAAEEGGGALTLDFRDLGFGGGDDALGQGGEEVIGRGVAADGKHLAGEPEVASHGEGGGAGATPHIALPAVIVTNRNMLCLDGFVR